MHIWETERSHIFFIQPSVNGHLTFLSYLCYSELWYNECGSASISLILVSFPLDMYPEMVLLDHRVYIFSVFWGIPILFSIMAEPICIPMNSAQGFFLPHPHQLFDSKHSHWCEIMSDCGFNLLFPDWASFHTPVGHFYVFFWTMHNSGTYFNHVIIIIIFAIEFFEFLMYFWYWPLIRYMIFTYYLPFLRLFFYSLDCFLCCARTF